MDVIAATIISEAYTYPQYRSLIDSLMAEGKTTGLIQTPSMMEYTQLNIKRMKRLDKTFRLKDEAWELLQQINRPVLWLTITEAWCGDAGQIIPVLHSLSQLNSNIQLRMILRDEHPDIMDAFLTDGSRSIPKVIFVDPESNQVLGSWGPRPEEAQEIIMTTKRDMELLEHDKVARKARYQQGQLDLHSWYARDRTERTQLEVLAATIHAQTAVLDNHLEQTN